ncbi:uncharacterized protein LOC125839918 [Solanum verrucosum]|uniref:uncharacterized protein LOC125839918 n=1 Tax=Solanum verrucosum TaxID=315347 RepID=UPI0020CFECDD|nr:uncharacterized protein LOC125839918 [Solanum verrucosum]
MSEKPTYFLDSNPKNRRMVLQNGFSTPRQSISLTQKWCPDSKVKDRALNYFPEATIASSEVTYLHLLYSITPIIAFLTRPALQSIVSKQVGPNEQGIAQGCIAGISSFGNILSPLIYTPLTDLFLSEKAPFNYPGFNLFCVGLAWLIALIPSMMIQFGPKNAILKIRDGGCTLDA